MSLTARIYCSLVFLVAAWCAGILLAPALADALPDASSALYRCYGPICHQIDARSFHLGGEKFAVCARCTSIYLGFFLALILFPLIRRLDDAMTPRRRWLAISVAPMLLDVALGFLGVHQSTLATRAISGGLFGVVIPFYIIPFLLEAMLQLRNQLTSRGGFFYARKAQ